MNPPSNENIKPTDPEVLNNIISDVFKDSGFAARHGPRPVTSGTQQVLLRASAITALVWQQMQQILDADHQAGGQYNGMAAFQTAHKLTMDCFKDWSRDDLLFLATTVHAEFILDKCNDYAEQLAPLTPGNLPPPPEAV